MLILQNSNKGNKLYL